MLRQWCGVPGIAPLGRIRPTRRLMCSMILSMSTTVLRATEITVDLPPEQAVQLFTPEGERQWANGWDPRYPEPDRREGRGAVFTTGHGGHQTTWIIVDQGRGTVRYARVTDGMTAGTVAVEVVGSREYSTHLRVTYDLTALSPAGESWLETFESAYHTVIGGWSTEIAAAIQSSGRRDS